MRKIRGIYKLLLLLTIYLNTGNPLWSQEQQPLLLADPSIFLHEDVYYLYGTSAGGSPATGDGFKVYTSRNLLTWEGPAGARDGYALSQKDVFGTGGFWAPQVFEHNGRFYMTYTADEHLAIAESSSPLGPFTNSGQKLEAPMRQIDSYVYFDDDGKKYLYHVRLIDGNKIFVAELKDDLSGIKPDTLVECIRPEEDWEDTRKVDWTVAEGPAVIKRNGWYYLFYTANDFRSPDYAVGYAISKSPLGPWEKYEGNPVISRHNVPEVGTGHGDIFMDKKGDWYYILHAHSTDRSVRPRKTALVKLEVKEQPGSPAIFRIEKDSFRLLSTGQ